MDDLDLDLGDTVDVTTLTTGQSFDLVVVGTTIVNDNFEKSPGRGGVVPVEWMDEAAPEVTADPYVLDLRDGADVEAFAASLGFTGRQVRGTVAVHATSLALLAAAVGMPSA